MAPQGLAGGACKGVGETLSLARSHCTCLWGAGCPPEQATRRAPHPYPHSRSAWLRVQSMVQARQVSWGSWLWEGLEPLQARGAPLQPTCSAGGLRLRVPLSPPPSLGSWAGKDAWGAGWCPRRLEPGPASKRGGHGGRVGQEKGYQTGPTSLCVWPAPHLSSQRLRKWVWCWAGPSGGTRAQPYCPTFRDAVLCLLPADSASVGTSRSPRPLGAPFPVGQAL